MLAVAAAGVVAGALHVLSGPDHLAAVAPLAADSRRSRWRTGLNWGIGHTSGVLVVGALALALREVLPVERISSFSERLVGAALVAVGLWAARRASTLRVHRHEHAHDGSRHSHVHVHAAAAAARHEHARHDHTHASFLFGLLHGLAGSSHVLGVLPALALPTRTASVVYLACYGLGNIASMTAFASAVGAVAARAHDGGQRLYRGLLYGCAAAAIIVGAIWMST
jgi:hypothetical protein